MKTLFVAKKIITMDASHPFATHIAVEDGKIVGLGDTELLDLFKDFQVDDQFKEKIILPGFIEAHSHALAGQDGLIAYAGYFDRPSVDGTTLKGHTSVDSLIKYLQEEEKKLGPNDPLVANGFDPIYFDGVRVNKTDLDKVSTNRIVMLLHASGHLMTINSFAVSKIPADKLSTQGVAKGQDGSPNGELQEITAMLLGFALVGAQFAKLIDPKVVIPGYMALAKRAGCTTVGEMGGVFELDDPAVVDEVIALMQQSPVRMVPAYFVSTSTKKPEEMPDYVKSLVAKSTDRVRFGSVKLVADGSLQGFTGRVTQPYLNGTQNGLWNQDPETLKKFALLFHTARIQMNCHCNGDEASAAFITAVKEAEASHPWPDNRHVVQHAQLVDEPQFLAIKALGMGANIFANHLYYWGDQHRDKILGPERANRMDAVNTALSLGVPFSLHSDANITPIAPLFNAWCAVNRLTATGKVLGEKEKISVEDALYAMTQGAAYLLKLEKEIGSVTIGKIADFVVLEKDPYAEDPKKLKDIKVITTVSGGTVNT